MQQIQASEVDLAEYGRVANQIIDDYYRDAAFRERVTTDATAVLRERGLPIPAGMVIKIVPDTADTVHLAISEELPDELSDESLNQVVGGSTVSTAACLGCLSCPIGTASSGGTFGSA